MQAIAEAFVPRRPHGDIPAPRRRIGLDRERQVGGIAELDAAAAQHQLLILGVVAQRVQDIAFVEPAIVVGENEELAARGAKAAVVGNGEALAAFMDEIDGKIASAGPAADDGGGFVLRAVVDDDDLGIERLGERQGFCNRVETRANRVRPIPRAYDHAKLHGCSLPGCDGETRLGHF
jgi:hypothetical protein